jgi:integrase
MARVGSINHQVGIMIKAHNGLSTSKMEGRNQSGLKSVNGHNISDKIHASKSLTEARNTMKNLGNYSHQVHGVKDMSKIDKEIITSWLNSKDISKKTASNYISIVTRFTDSKFIGATREELQEVREHLNEKGDFKEIPKESRAYDSQTLTEIKLQDNLQPAYELQRDYGLRVSAASRINVEKNLSSDNVLRYREKGGEWSEKQISPSLANKLREQAKNGFYSVSSKSTYGRHLAKALKEKGSTPNGTHGMRHSYAQNRLEQGAAKIEVSQEMGHKREEITNTYLR